MGNTKHHHHHGKTDPKNTIDILIKANHIRNFLNLGIFIVNSAGCYNWDDVLKH